MVTNGFRVSNFQFHCPPKKMEQDATRESDLQCLPIAGLGGEGGGKLINGSMDVEIDICTVMLCLI